MIGSNFKLTNLALADRFKLGNVPLKNETTFNYLGIVLDDKMTLFSKVIKIVSTKIYNLVRIRNLIDVNCALTIYKQTILPLLDYSGFMLISGNVSDRNNLQK